VVAEWRGSMRGPSPIPAWRADSSDWKHVPVTAKRRREPHRTATRSPGHLSVVAEPATRLELTPESVAEMPPDMREVVERVLDALVTALRAVRNPLEAELVVCNIFSAVETDAPGDADEGDRLAMLVVLLNHVILASEAAGTPAAFGLVQVCASLGPEQTRVTAAAAAARMAAAGVAAPGWAAGVGTPDVLRCWHQADALGAQENVGVLFSYRGREHALLVLVDHMLGGGVKDCWVTEGRQAVRMRNRFLEAAAGDPRLVFEDLHVRRAAEILTPALQIPPVADRADQIEDVGRWLYLLASRVEHLRRLTGVPDSDPSDPTLGEGEVLQLGVVLRHSEPPIWRRLEVPATTTLEQLHTVLQIAFDWSDDHLHEFEIVDEARGRRVVKGAAGRRTTLAHVLVDPGVTLIYRYDFGDDWEHVVTVEDRGPAEAGVRYPRCTGGGRAAPPEDSGGVPGYEELLEILADPNHPEHEDRVDWVGGRIDPDAFDPAGVEARLAQLSS
jgi:hypothetical protein